MKKKILAMLVIAIMLLSLMPATGLAADGTISANETHDLSEYGNDSTITIDPGLTVTLTNTANVTYTNLKVVCEAGVSLTISGVKIDDSATSDACAIAFTGSGNTLTLVGTSTLKSGSGEPGVRVEDGTALEIVGTGSIEATGGSSAAGIGGGRYDDGGSIMITGDASVTATGESRAAGIGGGYEGAGGTTTIKGDASVTAAGGSDAAGIGGGGWDGHGGTITITENASVTATGGNGGAGIGSGDAESYHYYGGGAVSGGNITISGDANVTATGGNGAAGIGGGDEGDCGTVTITDDASVIATGGYSAAAIGGGSGFFVGDGGTINISGGIVYAKKYASGSYDIGKGGGDDGTINISGSAAVFLGTNTTSPAPTTATHTHYEFTQDTEDAYGIPVPAEWTPTFGAYLILYDLDYDANGGKGPVPTSEKDRAVGVTVMIKDGDGLSYTGYGFNGWNTKADGSGTAYAPGDMFTGTEDTTLYAQWKSVYTLSYDANGGSGTVPSPEKDRVPGTVVMVKDGSGLSYLRHDFNGWNTAADGSGTAYAPGDTFTITKDATLYAQWEPSGVRYNANGGSGTAPSSALGLIVGEEIVIKNSRGLSYAGREFNGWNTAADGSGTAYAPGDTLSFTTSVTLYAQWTVPVTSVSLNKTSKTLKKGASITLVATVLPSGATNTDVKWMSTDTSVARVSQSGKVTAVSDGAASIIAKKDTAFDVCTVLVSSYGSQSDDGDDLDNGDNDDNVQPLATPAPSEKTEDVPDTVVVTIVVSELPEGTAAIQLPNGEVVELDGADTMKIEVDKSDIGEDGSVQLIALDEEGTPLGEFTASVQTISVLDAGSAWERIWPVLMWVLVGLGGLGAAGAAVYLVLKLKRGV